MTSSLTKLAVSTAGAGSGGWGWGGVVGAGDGEGWLREAVVRQLFASCEFDFKSVEGERARWQETFPSVRSGVLLRRVKHGNAHSGGERSPSLPLLSVINLQMTAAPYE